MILYINKTKIDLAASQVLSSARKESIGYYLETDLSAITDDSLTIIDLSGDAKFQNTEAASVLAKTLLQCGLPDSVKTINFIVSDVDRPQRMSSYWYQF